MLQPFVADRNIYLNEQSEIVEEDDDSRLTLLINKGGRLHAEVAAFHGLIETTMPTAEIEARNVPGDNAPGDNVPGDNVPGDNVPGDNAPGDNAPGDNAPGDNAPGDNDKLNGKAS